MKIDSLDRLLDQLDIKDCQLEHLEIMMHSADGHFKGGMTSEEPEATDNARDWLYKHSIPSANYTIKIR